MAMLDIEYRFSDRPLDAVKIRRKTTKDMEFYIRGLVFEMQSADISVKFTTGVPAEGERNMVYINGKTVPEILEGLDIKIPEPDEETCGCSSPKIVTIGGSAAPRAMIERLDIKLPEPDEETCGCSAPKIVTIGGPNLEWNTEFIEDIPDILMKNAISKTYADMEKNRIM